MALFTYDPAQVVITIGGIPMSGFSEATFIELAYTEPTWNMITGADGLTTRSKTNNYTATLTLTLKQSSVSNDVLSGLFEADRLSNAGVVPVMIKDLSGTTVMFSATGWIRQLPTMTFSKDVADRGWEIDLADVEYFIGGNAATA